MYCLANLFTPLIYIAIFAAFIIFLLALRKRTLKIWEDQGDKQKIMMDRQEESVKLLSEIRDLLKNK